MQLKKCKELHVVEFAKVANQKPEEGQKAVTQYGAPSRPFLDSKKFILVLCFQQ